jgi:predicted GTPase
MATFEENMARHAARYREIEHLRDRVELVSPGYAHTKYKVVLDGETRKLTDMDLIILADRGNACFGGQVSSRHAEVVYLSVYTD